MTNNLLIDQQKAHDAVSKAKALFDEAKKHEDDAQGMPINRKQTRRKSMSRQRPGLSRLLSPVPP